VSSEKFASSPEVKTVSKKPDLQASRSAQQNRSQKPNLEKSVSGHPSYSHPERSEGSLFSDHPRLAYIDYEINEFADEWSFEEWGVWYWANREGVARFLESGDSAAINDPPDSGKPIRTNPDMVQRWLEK
jgi:hypothetical protein